MPATAAMEATLESPASSSLSFSMSCPSLVSMTATHETSVVLNDDMTPSALDERKGTFKSEDEKGGANEPNASPLSSVSPLSPSQSTFPPTGRLPVVGRDKRRYGSLDAAALDDQGVLMSMSTESARPLSSMEDAEESTTRPSKGTTNISRRHSMDASPMLAFCSPSAAGLGRVCGGNPTGIPSDQQSIHPLQLSPEPRLSFASNPLSHNNTSTSDMAAAAPSNPTVSADRWCLATSLVSPIESRRLSFINVCGQQLPAMQERRKKSTFASKIRKVFNKPVVGVCGKHQDLEATNADMLKQLQVLEDIMSMSSRDDGTSSTLFGQGFLANSSLDDHRGSVSSTSSADTNMSASPGEFSLGTPLTSPEMSPSGSPKAMSAPLPSFLLTDHSSDVDSEHPTSDAVIDALSVAPAPSPVVEDAKKTGKRQNLEPTPTRTVKKRLSFASITSFFHPRSSEDATRKREKRSSSVPNVENPLSVVGRQIAGFQRRHSLNDMQIGSKHETQQPHPSHKLTIPAWGKDGVLSQAASAAGELPISAGSRNQSTSSADVQESTGTKSKIHNVFTKQNKRKNKGNQSNVVSVEKSLDNSVDPTVATAAKPLRSALTKRHQRMPSFRRTSQIHRTSIYAQQPSHLELQSQGAMPMPSRRQSLCEPLVDLSPDAGPTISRRSSVEELQQGRVPLERCVGPTRHRRQNSIAGRQASQHGHYPVMDRMHNRLSMRYSPSEEFDIFQYAETFGADQYPQQHPYQQQQQFQQSLQQFPPHQFPSQQYHYQGGGSFLSTSGADQQSQQFNSGSGVGELQSPPTSGSSSQDTSPVLAATHVSNGNGSSSSSNNVAVKVVPRNPALATVINHPLRRSSYHPGDSPNATSSYNLKRNSLIVTPGSRLSVDQSFLMEPHQAFANSVNSRKQYMQHQQHIQIQQHLQVQQQQFQRNQQQFQHHYFSDHHQQQQQQQQPFMKPLNYSPPHTPNMTLQEQYHPHSHVHSHPYPSYPYQFNLQHQPLPSHLHYSSAPQHPLQYHPHPHPHPRSHPYATHMPMTSTTNLNSTFSYNNNFQTSPAPSSIARPSRQLQFSAAQPVIHPTWTSDQYDRSSDPNITAHRLTPTIAQKIKLELNQFKSQEMVVHQESRVHTHFFV
ncbi:hypothetical protein BGX28_006705 [Mortierella sp. GBA30]|nr:hypothetical protein BGX28_006705 [Mortierella sp. GBA30]